MASEVRVNQIQNRSGLGTITVADTGVTVAGITTFLGNVNVSSGSSITVGDKFISSSGIGLGATTTAGRNTGINTVAGTLIYNSSTGTVQFYNGNRWVPTSEGYIEATGGTISDYTEGNTIYRSHIFTSSGTFSVTSAPGGSTVEYLVVAGGGGGGSNTPGGWAAGGGGAGGLRTGTGIPVSALPGSYSVTVGGGGGGGGNAGSSSIFSTITSNGGGGGGNSTGNGTGNPGNPGGSGGGGAGNIPSNTSGGTGNTPPVSPPQGNPGGASSGNTNNPGTGGGAGSAGYAGNPGGAATPGAGTGASYAITGIAITYAQGGGAQQNPGSNGIYSTGFGGDGRNGTGVIGGSGGSGIVIVRYAIGGLTATAKATGGLISYYNGKTIHTFLSSGTFTVTNPSLTSVETFTVAGGGGGGRYVGGGGGAGGIGYNPSVPVSGSPGVYTITVGAGAASSPAIGNQGSNTTAFGITAVGGGGGGNGGGTPNATATPGGSGGGGASGPGSTGTPGSQPAQPQPSGTINYGNPGGLPAPGSGGNFASSGGGGAGGAGTVAPNSGPGGPGGDGLQAPSTFRNPISTVGTPGPNPGGFYFGGGGGGSTSNNVSPTPAGSGGFGGGGAGGLFTSPGAPSTAAVDGTVNTGGGGGGGDRNVSPTGFGTNGGSGIVIIAYPS